MLMSVLWTLTFEMLRTFKSHFEKAIIYINISTLMSVLPASSVVGVVLTRLQNFITKIAPDHSTTLSSAAPPEGLDSTRAAGTF